MDERGLRIQGRKGFSSGPTIFPCFVLASLPPFRGGPLLPGGFSRASFFFFFSSRQVFFFSLLGSPLCGFPSYTYSFFSSMAGRRARHVPETFRLLACPVSRGGLGGRFFFLRKLFPFEGPWQKQHKPFGEQSLSCPNFTFPGPISCPQIVLLPDEKTPPLLLMFQHWCGDLPA